MAAWMLPAGINYLDLFGTKRMPGLKGRSILLDTRIPKQLVDKTQKAPMCVRFQSTGKCQQSCTLAHIASIDMHGPIQGRLQRLKASAIGATTTRH